MKIRDILSHIDLGSIALPEFQRGYVWNRDQVRGLMQSLYRRYPVGSLLVWVTQTENASARGDGSLQPGFVRLLLDGQQRITSLYGIIQGHAPKFFDGNIQAFTGLYFNLEDESFEFYAPLKMKDNPMWINVTELMKQGIGTFMAQFAARSEFQSQLTEYINRLTRLEGIKDIDLYIEDVSGEDKTVDVVVDVFNRVNTGGTKLSKGDLALAKICAAWPEARGEMKKRLGKWQNAGFGFKLDWLLRCVNSQLTGEAMFSALKDVDTQTFRKGLEQTEVAVDKSLNMISSRLGLDHDQVLKSVYAFPLIVRYIGRKGGHLKDSRERDKLLYWYVHTFLWGRYSASTESVLNQDLRQIDELDGQELDRLIELLRRNRGDLRISPNDFLGWSLGARFYPMLYMMTRVWHAQDWDSGVGLTNHLLGRLSQLQIHHIFPKAVLYAKGYQRPEVNALANFTFLTQETNLLISDQVPEVYFEQVAQRNPGALESHWIPMDKALWKVENYRDFLAARRELLAESANQFLDSLLSGAIPEPVAQTDSLVTVSAPSADELLDDEDRILNACNAWIVDRGLPEGIRAYSLADVPETILDLVWPEGLQPGLSDPIALLLNEEASVIRTATSAGLRVFTNVDTFKTYVMREILALSA